MARLERELAWLPMGVDAGGARPGLLPADGGRDPRPAQPLAAPAAARRGRRCWRWPRWWRRRSRARHEGRELRARLVARETRLAALEDTLSVLRRANMVLQTQISMNGHQGGLLIFQDAVSHRWCVIVHGLPPAPAGSKYQFWFITETGMVRSVEVNADMQRPAFMTLPMPGVAAPVMGAALTMEPVVNRSDEPRGCDAGARGVLRSRPTSP